VFIQRLRVGGIFRVIPGTGRHLHHAGPNGITQPRPRQQRASGIEHFHHVAIANTACGSIVRMDPQRLAPGNFGVPAYATVVILAMQAGTRLAGEQMQRPFAGNRLLILRFRLVPVRMTRTFFVAKPGNRLRKKLYLAGRCGKLGVKRIVTKILKQDLWLGRTGKFQHALLPEIIERRKRDPFGLGAWARLLIHHL
jgi:hypothetical protein